jgi:xanthine phosphoribosyltransferase
MAERANAAVLKTARGKPLVGSNPTPSATRSSPHGLGSEAAVRGSAVNALKERILKEGRNLGNGILKVDGFINHQIDPVLIDACGRELAARFEGVNATKVLTAEISGIAPALSTAFHLKVPAVYARRERPVTMPDQVLLTVAPSHTKRRPTELIVSPEYLLPGDRVLIIDDFLATGQTILGLVRLARAAGGVVVGIGAVIEKAFEGGRAALTAVGVPIEALAIVTSMSDGKIVLA